MLKRGGQVATTRKAYVVRDGEFDREPAVATEKIAILSLIAQWEADLPDTGSHLP
jgi:hypothetical protein